MYASDLVPSLHVAGVLLEVVGCDQLRDPWVWWRTMITQRGARAWRELSRSDRARGSVNGGVLHGRDHGL